MLVVSFRKSGFDNSQLHVSYSLTKQFAEASNTTQFSEMREEETLSGARIELATLFLSNRASMSTSTVFHFKQNEFSVVLKNFKFTPHGVAKRSVIKMHLALNHCAYC